MIITDLGRLRERPTREMKLRGWLDPEAAIYRIADSNGGNYSLVGSNLKLDLAYGVVERIDEVEKIKWHVKKGAVIEYGVAYGRLTKEILGLLLSESRARLEIRARGQQPGASLADCQAFWALDSTERAVNPELEAVLRPL